MRVQFMFWRLVSSQTQTVQQSGRKNTTALEEEEEKESYYQYYYARRRDGSLLRLVVGHIVHRLGQRPQHALQLRRQALLARNQLLVVPHHLVGGLRERRVVAQLLERGVRVLPRRACGVVLCIRARARDDDEEDDDDDDDNDDDDAERRRKTKRHVSTRPTGKWHGRTNRCSRERRKRGEKKCTKQVRETSAARKKKTKKTAAVPQR